MKVCVYFNLLLIVFIDAKISSSEIKSMFEGQVVRNKQNVDESKKPKEEKENSAIALCRGETGVYNKSLWCYYKFGDNKYLKLAPVKVEQLHIDPEVLMLHDVVSDEEAAALRRLAKPKLKSGYVGLGSAQSIHFRVSQVAWLLERDSELVSKMSRRIFRITDLSVNHSEPMQVASYGVGGFYKPHYDNMFDRKNKTKMLEGVRIATFLFYLSEVEVGGATIFLELGLTVFPKKNSAIFWKNCLSSGDIDRRLFHAACPVVRGHKWTAVKWISTIAPPPSTVTG